MYSVEGFRRKNGILVKEELSCGKGRLWEFLESYEAFRVDWEARGDLEAMKEMLRAFLKALQARGVEEICYERDEIDLESEPVPKCMAIEEVRDEKFGELASRVAANEIEVFPPLGALEKHVCSFSNRKWASPSIEVWSGEVADWGKDRHFPGEESRKLFCVHVSDDKIIVHLDEESYGRDYRHDLPLREGGPTVALKDHPEKVEVEFPEIGHTFETSEMATLYRLLFGKHKIWLLKTGQYREYRRLRKKLEKLNLLQEEELVEVAEKAVEELKKCRLCNEEFSLEKVSAREGRIGAFVAYAPDAEEAEELGMGEEGREVLAPVHLHAMWNAVEVYIGHDSHPIGDIAEVIRGHMEDVLRARGWSYTVERC